MQAFLACYCEISLLESYQRGGTILNQEQKQTDITTGKQIRHLRTQSGMTQEELAGKLNVTRQALSNWERDVNEPDLDRKSVV